VILTDERRGTDWTVPPEGARLGREPSLEIAFPETDNVVSAIHARVWRNDDGTWWLEDLESTNGTWIDGRRLTSPVLLGTGVSFSLGRNGPQLRVKIPGQVERTRAEAAAPRAHATALELPPAPLPSGGPALRLRRVRGGEDLNAVGRDILIGRAAECAMALRTVADTVVSKRHCRVVFDEAGHATIEDLGSRNGTFLNGKAVQGQLPLRAGDRIMMGWEGPLFEVRVVGDAAMGEAEGAPYQPRREPPKTLAGMVQVADLQARRVGAMRPVVFARTLVRQMALESSRTFRVVTIGLILVLIAVVGYVWRVTVRRAAQAEARLESAEHTFAQQMRQATSAQERSSVEITELQRALAEARRQAVSRAVLDSLERRLREAEARVSESTAAPGSATTADFTRVARDNQRAVGLVIVRYGSDSVMGSGFALTPSGYFVTNRHVVQDDLRGPARSVIVVMAESNLAQPADVVAISSVAEQDVAILKVRGFRGGVVQAVDWYGRGAQQGAPAAMLGFPFGTQLAQDEAGLVHASMFGGIIAQVGDWIRFSGNTYAGVSGSPLFNAAGEVIAVHFGQPHQGMGLGVAVPMSLVRRWLPADARAELGL
jgi:pSer/pThr/pTyr-binding forkhead associated (FHA) protein/S1-C subfamily serine protease